MADRHNEDGYRSGRRPVGRKVEVKAPAKVNLHLEILRQRHDGYHEIETVLQAVGLYDRLTVELVEQRKGSAPEIELKVLPRAKGVPEDETNLCWQATRLFCSETRVSGHVRIVLEKGIPAAAGLGGGSSDAAGVLIACNRLFGTGLEVAQIQEMGAKLGSDVPFFVRGATALGRGTGTILTPLPAVRTAQFLIVKPNTDLKTSDVYAKFKMGLTVNSAKANIGVLRSMLARFPESSWPGFNRLEEVVLPEHPSLQRLVLQMRELAPVAMLSGSGSAVVGVFKPGRNLTEIVEEFEQAGLFVRVVGPHAGGIEITDA